MKTKELREWLNNLPAKFDDFEVVYREIKKNEQEEGFLLRDTLLVTAGVDEDHKELGFCNQESSELINQNQDENEKQEEALNPG